MNVIKIIQDLKTERDRIEEAISVLTRLNTLGGAKRRGRPPNWMRDIKDHNTTRRRKTRKTETA